jgi:AraC-like DNA-binding protein
VAELVLFGRVRGEFIAEGRRHRLSDGDVVFVPSMRRHDFALERGDMDWVLVQVDPFVVEALALKPMLARLTRPFCASPVGQARERVAMLGDWLVEAAAGRTADASVVRIVELLLLERIRAAPAEPITLEAAAAICSLSPAYFSRRFSQVFGMGFTEYVRIHRLHLAARRIATSGAAISSVAYDLGFSSPSYFTARFRERFAMTPREYRASARSRASA